MLTEVLATYAAVVSTASLGMTYATYRSGDPRLSGDAYIMGRFDVEGPTLHVNVYNRGRAAVTVQDLTVWASTSKKQRDQPLLGWPVDWSRGALPMRIEGHSGEHFSYPAHRITTDWLHRDDLQFMDVRVQLATGRTLLLEVETENIDVLDPEKLPAWDPDYFKNWPKGTDD